jgi:hypothetical protein
MLNRCYFRALILLAVCSACISALPLTINFNSALLTAGRGQTVTFSASVANTTAATVFLDADALNVAAPLLADDTRFFLNFPLALAGFSATPVLPTFDILIPSGTPFGLYPGHFDILQGTASVGSADFAVTVVPEPATLSLLTAGALGLGLMFRFSPKRNR